MESHLKHGLAFLGGVDEDLHFWEFYESFRLYFRAFQSGFRANDPLG